MVRKQIELFWKVIKYILLHGADFSSLQNSSYAAKKIYIYKMFHSQHKHVRKSFKLPSTTETRPNSNWLLKNCSIS